MTFPSLFHRALNIRLGILTFFYSFSRGIQSDIQRTGKKKIIGQVFDGKTSIFESVVNSVVKKKENPVSVFLRAMTIYSILVERSVFAPMPATCSKNILERRLLKVETSRDQFKLDRNLLYRGLLFAKLQQPSCISI